MDEHFKAILKSYYTVGVDHCDLLNIFGNKLDIYHKDLINILSDIEKRKLNIDDKIVEQLYAKDTKVILNRYMNSKPYIKYDFLSHKTGRLKVFKDYFNILNMPKRVRTIIKPNNDFFLSLDYNAADFRVFLSLSGIDQPKIDLHEYHRELLYNHLSREEVKIAANAWLYSYRENEFDKLYNKYPILNKYWNNGCVINPYNRKIPVVEQNKAMNYLISSTTSDILFRQAIKIHKMLKNLKSYIAFLIHDSIWIDVSFDDKFIFKKIKNIFSQTDFGNFLVNIEYGENFGKVEKHENNKKYRY